MCENDEICARIWVSEFDLTANNNDVTFLPKPPPRIHSIKTYFSENEYFSGLEDYSPKLTSDVVSQSCLSFEGESVENLDIDFPTFEDPNDQPSKIKNDTLPIISYSQKSDVIVSFPKKPCFSEFNKNETLEYFGDIIQIFQKITTSRKNRYGVLLSDKFILFKKPEHKVSKLQIPIDRITGIYWYSNMKCLTRNDCNKFKIDTAIKSYKFQCLDHDHASLWINHIAKLLISRLSLVTEPPSHILKATVTIENVKGKRIFILEPQYTLAYYECEDHFCNDLAMHRVQLRSSGVRRDVHNNTKLDLITSYRRYKLSFESSDICEKWFLALSAVIHKAIASSTVSNNVKSGDTIITEIYSNVSNRRCADCDTDNPEWASVNLFVTLCNNCSGIHRGLGRHISTIQGILTDESTWQDANIVKLFLLIGNERVNNFFLSRNVVRNDDQRFVYDKYVKKSFMANKHSIFAKYSDQEELNEEFMKTVQTDDVLRSLQLYHIGADITHVDRRSGLTVFEAAEKSGQHSQLTFLNNQSKNVIRDWRNVLFDADSISHICDIPFQERCLQCSLNDGKREQRRILIWTNHIQVLHNESKSEICKVFFENICLIREKENSSVDQIGLIVIVRETGFSASFDTYQTINKIELFNCSRDQPNDVRDFKNVIALNMCPPFQPNASFDCIGWVILSTPVENWAPYLLVLNSNRCLDFHSPMEINGDTPRLKLDLRKVQKIEDKGNSCQTSCQYKMYNLDSICLISSVIYHIRSDTKFAHDEYVEALKHSWSKKDLSLHNQYLTNDNVPVAVHKMIQFLRSYGSKIEGLFRQSGSVKEAEKICSELVNDPASFVLKECSPHDVASALKLFFRKLDDPLLTTELYQYWIAAVEIKNADEQIKSVKSTVVRLPLVNYVTLRQLVFLLREIVVNYRFTQMNPSTLSTSFSTSLLLTSVQNHGFSHADLHVLPLLLENYVFLFEVTEEELVREEVIRKSLEQICSDKVLPTTTLLRQIYIETDLESFLRSDVNFERENCAETRALFTKQIVVELLMTCDQLKSNMLSPGLENDRVALFEERDVDTVRMHRIIYPRENFFALINYSETFESKSARRWIFKSVAQVVPSRNSPRTTFQCWCFLSPKNKNRVYIELTDSRLLNIWRSELCQEQIAVFQIKSVLLYRSCQDGVKLVAFKDSRTPSNSLSSNFTKRFHSSSSKSPYHYVNFAQLSDYEHFLNVYDQIKIRDLSSA